MVYIVFKLNYEKYKVEHYIKNIKDLKKRMNVIKKTTIIKQGKIINKSLEFDAYNKESIFDFINFIEKNIKTNNKLILNKYESKYCNYNWKEYTLLQRNFIKKQIEEILSKI